MKITFKTENGNYTTATIQILRNYTSESIGEIKNRLVNNLPLLYLDSFDYESLDDAETKAFEIIDSLEKSGIQLAIYVVSENERKIDKQQLQNYFQSWKGIQDDTERFSEMETTEIVAAVHKSEQLIGSHTLISENSFNYYYLFNYSQELVDFIKSTAKSETIQLYQRARGEQNKEEWQTISPHEIQILMGF